MPAITQKEIAEQLGVSRQLVGFALSGQGRVSEQTRQRILDFAHQNGYNQFSNHEARAMTARRYGKRAATGIIAVLFLADFENQPLSNVPYFTPFFRGFEIETQALGLDLILCPIRPDGLPRLVRDRQLDGAICLSMPHEVSRNVHLLNVPIVNIQSDVEGIPCILRDDFGGGFQATQHLIEMGNKRLGYLGFDSPSGDKRLAAFHQALTEHHLPVLPEFVDGTLAEPTQEAGEQAMKKMLARGPLGIDSLVCFNDLIAMGAIRVLQEHNYSIPNDISIIGFDDVASEYSFKPALSSICFAREAMARRSIHLLMQLIEAEAKGEVPALMEPRQIFATRLVPRHSTQIVRTQ